MNHTDASNRIALTCAYLHQDALAADLAIRVAKQCGISGAVAMQVTARTLADDMDRRSNGPRRPGKTTLRMTATALRALAELPVLPRAGDPAEMSPELRALA